MTPDHFDFIRNGITSHALLCEAWLLADNVARMFGASTVDSLALSWRLLRVSACLP
jgi:hypothetical protein